MEPAGFTDFRTAGHQGACVGRIEARRLDYLLMLLSSDVFLFFYACSGFYCVPRQTQCSGNGQRDSEDVVEDEQATASTTLSVLRATLSERLILVHHLIRNSAGFLTNP